MAIQVIDNFLDKEEFNNLSSILMSNNFPWFFNEQITNEKDPKDYCYFTHTFYIEPGISSNYFQLFNNFLKKIECKSIVRIKANLYFNQNKKQIHKAHIDYPFSHKGCLFYINDNNGLTYFENKSVKPKANRIVFFNPSKKHSSSLCTDKNRRVNPLLSLI